MRHQRPLRASIQMRSTALTTQAVPLQRDSSLTIRKPTLETRHLRRESFDVIVLGAGAAGLMCAIEAGKRGRRVAVLERAERVGKKILISGGGRCNFTNLHAGRRTSFPQTRTSASRRWRATRPRDFIALVEKHGICLSREEARPVVLRSRRAGHRRACSRASAAPPALRFSPGVQVKEVERASQIS